MTTAIETYEAAKTASDLTVQAWMDCEHSSEERCEHRIASDAAMAAAEAALEAVKTEPRTWELCEGGHWYDTEIAASPEAALQVARDNVDPENYGGQRDNDQRTFWIDVIVRCTLTHEEASDTVTIDPREPKCTHPGGHDWQAPHALVGGSKTNPGVHGHGAGVIISVACVREGCGCGKSTDTWASRPDTGAQGLRSITYEPRKYLAMESA